MLIYIPYFILIIFGIYLSIQDYKTYTVKTKQIILYVCLLSFILYQCSIPYYFIPIILLGILFINIKQINSVDLLFILLNLYLIIYVSVILKFKFLIYIWLLPILITFYLLSKYKEKIPYIVIGHLSTIIVLGSIIYKIFF